MQRLLVFMLALWKYYAANYTVINIEPHLPVVPPELRSVIFSFVRPIDLVKTNAKIQFNRFVSDDEDLWRLLRMFRDIPELFTDDGPWRWLQNMTFHHRNNLVTKPAKRENIDRLQFPCYCDWEGIECTQRQLWRQYPIFKFEVSISIANPHRIHWSEIPKPMFKIEIFRALATESQNDTDPTIPVRRPLIDFCNIDSENRLDRIKMQIKSGDFQFNGDRVIRSIWSIHLNTSDGVVIDYSALWKSMTFAHFIKIQQSEPMKLSDFEHFRCLKGIEMFIGKWNTSDSSKALSQYLHRFKYYPQKTYYDLYTVQCEDEKVMIWSSGWCFIWTVVQAMFIVSLLFLVIYLMITIDNN